MADPIDAIIERLREAREEIAKSAEISECGLYRYSLARTWDHSSWPLPFVMLNPSTADADIDDPTIRRCVGFAKREGYGGILVANLFAYRATKPSVLKQVDCPVGPRNEFILASLCHQTKAAGVPIVCAWGANAAERGRWFTQWAKANGSRLVCLGTTASGEPRHPLYVRGDQPLVEYAP